MLYQFRVKDFSFVWHDTVGKIQEEAPVVVSALQSLPPTDVHFGAVLAFGQVTNCLRSLGHYIRALAPEVYTPAHHDNFTYLIGGNARDLESYVRDEIDRIPEGRRPRIHYTYDPEDYLDPSLFTFDPRSRRWSRP